MSKKIPSVKSQVFDFIAMQTYFKCGGKGRQFKPNGQRKPFALFNAHLILIKSAVINICVYPLSGMTTFAALFIGVPSVENER